MKAKKKTKVRTSLRKTRTARTIRRTAAKVETEQVKETTELNESDYPIYKPAFCKQKPVVGFLLERKTFSASKGGLPWDAFVILLTQPTLAVTHDDNVITVPAGSKVTVPAFAKLDLLNKLASDPEVMSEIAIQPGDETDIGNGRTLQTFRQKVLSVKNRITGAANAVTGSTNYAEWLRVIERNVALQTLNDRLQAAHDVLQKRNSELEIVHDKHLKIEESYGVLIDELQTDKRELEDNLLFFVMKAYRRRMKKSEKINSDRFDEE